MRILIVMDPGILVPPKGYGGHERLVAMFARQYHKLGHEVELLVTPGSEIEGCLVHPFGTEGFPPLKWDALKAIPDAWGFLYANRHKYDLIHNFGRLLYLLPILNTPVKKIMTYGREISNRNIRWINKLPNRNLVFTGCSQNLISRCITTGVWKTVYNAIEFDKYKIVVTTPQNAPLVFLGRIEKVKGCHTAIEVAKATGNKLVIAGNKSSLQDEQGYFEKEIAPHIDGDQIQWIGQVNDEQKNTLLGAAKALVFPIEWNEPFGMVMVEAMACGTPVIAFNRGSVNEVIDEGITGNKVENFQEMVDAVNDLSISRESCAYHARRRFDISVIANEYLNLHDE